MAFNFVRVPEKGKVATPQQLVESFNATPYKVDLSQGYSICAEVLDTTPATGATFDTGVAEASTFNFADFATTGNGDHIIVTDTTGLSWSAAMTKPRYEANTLNFADAAATANGDYVVLTDAAGLTWAVALQKGVFESNTINFADRSATANGDYIVLTDAAAGTWAVGLTKTVNEVQTLTFEALGDTDDGDLVIVETAAGVKYALHADTTGMSLVVPSGPLWDAVPVGNRSILDISAAAGDAASVAALMEIGWNALPGFTAAITTDDTAANGTMTLTQVLPGPTVDPVPKNADESGAGGILGVETTAGIAAQTPTGAAWVAVAAPNKTLVDITAIANDEDIAAAVETALALLAGFTTAFTTDDSAGDGTMLLTCDAVGPCTDPTPHTFDDGGAGSIANANVTEGVALQTPTGAAWVAVNAARKVLVDVTSTPNDEDIAALVETALATLTGFTTAFTTDDSAGDGTMLLTADAYGPCTDPTPHTFDDGGAGSIANTNVLNGVAAATISAAPFVAIPAGRKTTLDLTALVGTSATDAQIAAAVETGLNALTGFSAVMTTDDSAADGTLIVTQDSVGLCTDPAVSNATGGGAGSVTVGTVQGVNEEVNIADDEISLPAHGMETGLLVRFTTTGTLPAGLSLATDYYIIAVDADTFSVATSYVLALAGTALDITDTGTGVHTVAITVDLSGTFKLQASNNCYTDNTSMELRDDTHWTDIASSTATLDGGDDSVMWNVADCYYEAVRVVWTQTAGQGTAAFYFIGKRND